MSEQNILDSALESLNRLTGATYSILEMEALRGKIKIDALIKIGVAKKESLFTVEIKQEVRQSNLANILHQLEAIKGNKLIISRYIPKPLKQELKERGVNYLEAAGNCYIQTDQFFIYINDQKVTDARVPEKGRLWNIAGLKFLFAVLQSPNLLHAPYRDMALVSNIALGNIGPLLNELEQEGYLRIGIKDDKKIKFLDDKPRLIQRWAELYRAVLRPKLIKGNFRFAKENDHREWKSLPVDNFLWGGENAGAILTDYLFPEDFTIYTHVPVATLMKELKLVPSSNGKVEILEQFWQPTNTKEDMDKTIPPLLAYAELITSFDSRCRETAERIKARYLD